MNAKYLNPFDIDEMARNMSDSELEDMLSRLRTFISIYNRKKINSQPLEINYCYYYRELEHRYKQKRAHQFYERNRRSYR